MTDSMKCSNCGTVNPIISPAQIIRGPRTPDEQMLEEARRWAYGAFSRTEPVAADVMRGLIAALEGVRQGTDPSHPITNINPYLQKVRTT